MAAPPFSPPVSRRSFFQLGDQPKRAGRLDISKISSRWQQESLLDFPTQFAAEDHPGPDAHADDGGHGNNAPHAERVCIHRTAPGLADAVMTERMGGSEGPGSSAEAYASCPMPTEGLDPSTSDEGGVHADHEMQWISARENPALQESPLDNQIFLTPPQDLGDDLLGSLCPEPCEELLPGETCEDMSRDPPAEPPCEEMPAREPPETSCRGQCRGWPLPCEQMCQESSEHSPPGGQWPGKARLPSIVVEPTEDEVESGELRWPADHFLLLEEDDEGPEPEELFAEGEESLETGLSSFDSDVEEVLL